MHSSWLGTVPAVLWLCPFIGISIGSKLWSANFLPYLVVESENLGKLRILSYQFCFSVVITFIPSGTIHCIFKSILLPAKTLLGTMDLPWKNCVRCRRCCCRCWCHCRCRYKSFPGFWALPIIRLGWAFSMLYLGKKWCIFHFVWKSVDRFVCTVVRNSGTREHVFT